MRPTFCGPPCPGDNREIVETTSWQLNNINTSNSGIFPNFHLFFDVFCVTWNVVHISGDYRNAMNYLETNFCIILNSPDIQLANSMKNNMFGIKMDKHSNLILQPKISRNFRPNLLNTYFCWCMVNVVLKLCQIMSVVFMKAPNQN